MNPRCAATLALAGWYLMVPPIERAGGMFWVPANEPLSMWSTDRTFSSEDECNSALADLKQPHVSSGNMERAQDQQRQRSICVATDDPRLAK